MYIDGILTPGSLNPDQSARSAVHILSQRLLPHPVQIHTFLHTPQSPTTMRSFISTLCLILALLPALTLARPATPASRGYTTNSECLKRGLPLLRPRTKRTPKPRVAYQTV
jgi:hypothetical protein